MKTQNTFYKKLNIFLLICLTLAITASAIHVCLASQKCEQEAKICKKLENHRLDLSRQDMKTKAEFLDDNNPVNLRIRATSEQMRLPDSSELISPIIIFTSNKNSIAKK